jgi:hypothetical protein
VTLDEDVRVTKGATLTIEAGATILFGQALSTKTDPQMWNPDTELAVEGTLKVVGTAAQPVSFAPLESSWGGIVAAPGANVQLRGAVITGADEALLALGSTVSLSDVTIRDCRHGLVAGVGAVVKATGVKVSGCEVGVLDMTGVGGPQKRIAGIDVSASEDSDYLKFSGFTPLLKQNISHEKSFEAVGARAEGERELLGEYTVNGEEVWSGRVVVSGRVTVPPGSMLRLSPGTHVAFRRIDTNSDGLGEGELLVLGSIRSQGTKERPVVFESAELSPRAGDWDKVSIIASEDADNSFVHTVFRHGIQPLHAHFATFSVTDSLFEDNLRGLQFQESERATIVSNRFVGNKQAIRMRDSTVLIEDNIFQGNLFAVHAFRCQLTFKNNTVEDTLLGGMLAKESQLVMTGNTFSRNRFALRVKGEGSTTRLSDNAMRDVAETIVSFNEAVVTLDKNTFDSAGLDLLGVNGGTILMRHNLLGSAARHALHLSGPATVDALENTWQGGDPALRIFDAQDDPTLGEVRW